MLGSCRFPALVLAAVVLAISACDGGDDPTRAAGTATTTTTSGVDPNQRFARSLLIPPEDLPAGFAAVPGTGAESDPATEFIERCFPSEVQSFGAHRLAGVESPRYERGESSVVLEVTVFDSPVWSERAVSLIGTAEFRTCAGLVLLDQGGDAPTAASGEAVDLGSYGDETLSVRVSTPGEPPRPVDIMVARDGPALFVFVFSNPEEPFPPAERESIVSRTLARVP